MSSGSSLGSLGSLSSRGSLQSLNGQLMDLYQHPQQHIPSETNLHDLHRRLEKLLQGHTSVSPIHEFHEHPQNIVSSLDNTSAATMSYMQSVMASGSITEQQQQQPSIRSFSSRSSLASMSPPVSPYDIGLPPTYENHLMTAQQLTPYGSNTSLTPSVTSLPPDIAIDQSNYPYQNVTLDTSAQVPRVNMNLQHNISVGRIPVAMPSVEVPQGVSQQGISKRVVLTQYTDAMDVLSNPPLSPISESSSGVYNTQNASGGNTRSVSAAVSDESVAGDSGVFEASVNVAKKRYVYRFISNSFCL